MEHINRWMFVVLMIATLGFSGCTQSPDKAAEKSAPVLIEPIEETGLNRVVLTEKAAERLGIQTAPVRAEKMERKRIAWGEVLDMPEIQAAGSNSSRVFVSLNGGDAAKVDRSRFALVMVLDDEGEVELEAEPDESADVEDADEDAEAMIYLVDNPDQKLVPGQVVRIVLPLLGSDTEQIVVPYSAVIYDLNGETWVYTRPEPLVFVRHPIVVDYIEGGLAFLLEGPPAGTEVATVGVAELYGADTGVGK